MLYLYGESMHQLAMWTGWGRTAKERFCWHSSTTLNADSMEKISQHYGKKTMAAVVLAVSFVYFNVVYFIPCCLHNISFSFSMMKTKELFGPLHRRTFYSNKKGQFSSLLLGFCSCFRGMFGGLSDLPGHFFSNPILLCSHFLSLPSLLYFSGELLTLPHSTCARTLCFCFKWLVCGFMWWTKTKISR